MTIILISRGFQHHQISRNPSNRADSGGFAGPTTKVRYRGLAKNTGQIVTLFALTNLWLARKRLLPLMGEVRP